MKWTTIAAAVLAALMAIAGCGASALPLRADGPPPSTFQTPPPVADQAPAAPPRPTADIVGTAEVRP